MCSLKVIKPNEALQGLTAFSVFLGMKEGFVPQPQWNKGKRVAQKLHQACVLRASWQFETSEATLCKQLKALFF